MQKVIHPQMNTDEHRFIIDFICENLCSSVDNKKK